MSVIFEGAVGWAVGWMGDALVASVADRLRNRAALVELGQIGERAIEAAVREAPGLAEDLRSETFKMNVAGPMVVTALARPGDAFDSADLAQSFLERFVVPFLKGPSTTETLQRVFQTEPEPLTEAFKAFLETFRTEVLASKHWRERMETRLLAETHAGLARVEAGIAQLLNHVQPSPPAALATEVSLSSARQDAWIGSEALTAWPRTIGDQWLERPELDLLVSRVRATPDGRTLLVGEPGAGKSALLAGLSQKLRDQGMTVFAIKSDQLDPEVSNLVDMAADLGMSGDIGAELEVLARAGPLVLIIDQLDAVSDVMDQSGRRMRLLIRLATAWRSREGQSRPPVHVIVSSRPFEAQHDARFRALDAETVELALPSFEQVEALLAALDVPAPSSPSMRETLRRPFALRLYVDIHHRGAAVEDLVASDLLTAWLEAANLGEGPQRQETLTLLAELADDMTRSESLWRPADRYIEARPQGVRLGQASGLLVVQDGKIGYSHQTWLDDFQARHLSSPERLSQFVQERQDGLFCRATTLRALQRLRRFEPLAYDQAIDRLLLDPQTRRHIRHLVVDQLSAQPNPGSREIAWVEHFIQHDPILARRALGRAASHWAGWRGALTGRLPSLMADTTYRWNAILFLQHEAEHDLDGVLARLETDWSGADQAVAAFEVVRALKAWTPRLEALVDGLFSRHTPPDYRVSKYADDLVTAGQPAAAARLVRLYVARLDQRTREKARLHRFDKLAAQAPLEVATELWPWLVAGASAETIAIPSAYVRYRRIGGRFRNIERPDQAGGLVQGLIAAMRSLAAQDPDQVLVLLRTAFDVEIDDIQALIATTLAAAAPALLDESLAYLLADPRRLALGRANVLCPDSVYRGVEGLASMQLIEAIGEHLAPQQLDRLILAIETWEPFSIEARTEDGPGLRRERRRWSEERRLALLERLPQSALSARRRRHVREWRAVQDVPRVSQESVITLAASRSAMSAEQMAKASDRDLLRMIDLIDDRFDRYSRRGWRSGGVVELARAFAAFGSAQPDRALALAALRLVPGRHEQVGGELVSTLAARGDVPAAVLALVHRQADAGFASPGWRLDAAMALERLAGELSGLGDEDLSRLESWTEPFLGASAEEASDDDALADRPGPLLFERHRGIEILQTGNVTVLSAIAEGLVRREPADVDGLLSFFDRQLDRPERTGTWSRLIALYGGWLQMGDRERSDRFFRRLFQTFPDAFDASSASVFLWNYRGFVPADVLGGILDRWLDHARPELVQLAGEFITGLELVDEPSERLAVWRARVWSPPGRARLGGLYAAAAAWRDEYDLLGAKAQALLLPSCADAVGDEAEAIASAIGFSVGVDARAAEPFLRAIAANRALLAPCLTHRMGEMLQDLLLQPGAEPLVLDLAEATASLLGRDEASTGMIDDDLVRVVVAIQRGGGAMRERAMTIYEQLLDLDSHEAQQAAADALRS